MDVDLALTERTLGMCSLAYSEPAVIERRLGGLDLREMAFSTALSTQAFVARDDTAQYLVFRGSDVIADWLANARFLPTSRELGVHIHTGFIDALDEVWDELTAALRTSSLPVVVTGHSLGGALAALAALRLATSGTTVTAVFTYGQPRTGHADFRARYDSVLQSVTFRFINHIDLVTRVPLLLQSYRHVGRRMYIDADGTFHRDASAWHVAWDDLKYRLRHFGRIDSIGTAPHLIGPYRDRIGAIQPARPGSAR